VSNAATLKENALIFVTVLPAVGCFRHLIPEVKTFGYDNIRASLTHQYRQETVFLPQVVIKCNSRPW